MTTTFGTISNLQFVTNRRKDATDPNGTLSHHQQLDSKHGSYGSFPNNGHSSLMIVYPSGKFRSPSTKEMPCNVFVDNSSPSPCNSNCSSTCWMTQKSRPPSYGSGDQMDESLSTDKLDVEKSPSGSLRFATDRPHLVSMGGGRLSTSVTLHPINEGKTILGSGGMGVIPDIPVLGTGVDPEHCLLENKDGVVTITPLAPMVAIDGIRITSVRRLTQGCMICLGRSHFFRFNHPAEAKFIRSILPNVRISMAPIAFYPAVDNPEYFQMPSMETGSEENAAVVGSSSNGSLNGNMNKENRPLVPPRKTPPSSLPLPNNAQEGSPKNFNDKVFHFEGLSPSEPSSADLEKCSSNGKHFFKKINQPGEESDSDVPPEIPPRSEESDSLYVNSPTLYSSSNQSFLGEYVYTKAETEPVPQKPIPGATRVAVGAATVVSPNGTTTVHNALYRSLPPVSQNNNNGSPTSYFPTSPNGNHAQIFTFNTLPHTSSPIMATNPSYCLTAGASSDGSQSPSHIEPVISHSNASFVNHSSSLRSYSPRVSSSFQVSSSPIHSYMNTSNLSCNMEAGGGLLCHRPKDQNEFHSPSGILMAPSLTDQLVSTEMKKMKAVEERLKDEEEAKAEKERLDEILLMCAEYERQQKDPSGVVTPTKSPNSPYQTLTQNRIKTNGSLPRENRTTVTAVSPHSGVSSPAGSLPLSPISPCYRAIAPDEDPGAVFRFEDDQGQSDSINRNLLNYPPFPNNISGLAGCPSPPPGTPRSPYENVSYPVPQSPRTRIRTTVGKERREACEVIENKLAISDFNTFGKERILRSVSRSPELPFSNGDGGCLDAPPKPPRSPRIERGVLEGPNFHRGRRSNSNEGGIANKYFAPVTPKSKWSDVPEVGSGFKTDYSSSCRSESFSHLNTKFKTKAFEEHMLKNIQDTLNINDVSGEIRRLTEEKSEFLKKTADLKSQIMELESQENESLSELDMERALVEGELRSSREKLNAEESRLAGLLEQSREMEERHAQERLSDQEFIARCKERLEDAEGELEVMEEKKGGRDMTASSEEEKEILETLKAQHEAVDAEKKFFLFYLRWKRAKKVFEDTEFSQMESEALRESEREELNKEILETKVRVEGRKEKIAQLESQMSEMTISVCKETEALENQRQVLIALVNKERMRVTAIDRQFGELARLGVMSLDNGGQTSPTCSSSDTDEGSAPELSERLAKLHLVDRSQEDLDKINQITMTSPLDCHDTSLSRKTSSALQEIERNRQRMLAKQGTMAIDQERRRMEELKKRAAQEVKDQWEEKKAKEQRKDASGSSILRQEKHFREQREVNCASLNSIGSEDSSMTSSDLHTESLSSDDVIGQRMSSEIKMRQRDLEAPNCVEEQQSRPLSDASSFCEIEGQPVKFRDKPRNQQRPLTRFLPVRTEENFNLRQHIESAGHQIELCNYLTLNETCCRGYLHKLGSKFKTWHKRWFVFDRSKRALIYYCDKNELKPRGGVYFQAIEEVYVNHLRNVKSPSPKLTFCVKTRERTFQLMASSPEAMRIWIDVVFTGAEGYHEFQGGT